jgi:hypothetical protein
VLIGEYSNSSGDVSKRRCSGEKIKVAVIDLVILSRFLRGTIRDHLYVLRIRRLLFQNLEFCTASTRMTGNGGTTMFRLNYALSTNKDMSSSSHQTKVD